MLRLVFRFFCCFLSLRSISIGCATLLTKWSRVLNCFAASSLTPDFSSRHRRFQYAISTCVTQHELRQNLSLMNFVYSFHDALTRMLILVGVSYRPTCASIIDRGQFRQNRCIRLVEGLDLWLVLNLILIKMSSGFNLRSMSFYSI